MKCKRKYKKYAFTTDTDVPHRIFYSIGSNPNNWPESMYLGTIPTYLHRRITWRDVKSNILNTLIIMRDFLLIRSRSFLENLDSVNVSTSSTNGRMVKPVQSLYGMTSVTGPLQKPEYMNTIFSDGSLVKRRGLNRYGIKTIKRQSKTSRRTYGKSR